MNRLLLLLCITLSNLFSSAQITVVDSIIHGGVWRNYRLFLPTSFNASTSLPLVFNLHGYSSNALEQELYSSFDAVADTGNFIVCYPNGLNNSWNIFGGPTDDIGFIDTLIDVFHSAYNINKDRVYSTGLSNGGFMSNYLACELSEKIAAIAPVAGTNTTVIQAGCSPSRMVPVLYIHGTADGVVNYNGTTGIVSVATLLSGWSAINDCSSITDTVNLADINTNDQCTAQKITWHSCDSNKQVVHYKIIGGGHTWPGAPVNIGVTNQDFNASGVIWNFFNQFSLSTNVNTIQTNPVRIYPNPFFSDLTIDLPFGGRKMIQLFSSEGRLIQTTSSDGDKVSIAGKYISDGFYILKVTAPGFSVAYPVVRVTE